MTTPLSIFVTTGLGLEPILAQELAELGFPSGSLEPGGVELGGTMTDVARLNLSLRTASRVVVRIMRFRARTFPELERHAAKVPWESFLPAGGAAHFRVTAKKSRLNHERAIAERLTRGLLLRVPGAKLLEQRSEVALDERDPRASVEAQRFVVRVHRDLVTVSADSSGPLLHRRGYRADGGKAPLRETLAAALLRAAQWNGTTPLIDPFTGSGTIPIEAALLARNIPPGWSRRFAFEGWPPFDRARYAALRSELERGIRSEAAAPIVGSDRDRGAVARAIANADQAGVAGSVSFREAALSAIVPPEGRGLLASNPPYGARVGEVKSLRDLYAQLGHVLRGKLAGWQVALVSADPALERQVGVDWKVVAATENGGIKVRFVAATVDD